MSKRFLVICFCLVVLIGSLLACGESSNTNTGTSVNTNTSSSSSGSTPTTAPAAQHFKVGQTVNVGSQDDITIHSAKIVKPGQYDVVQHKGDVYLVFDVSMKNTSNQEQDISTFSFTLRDTSGQQYDQGYVSGQEAMLTGKVEPGSSIKGSITYEIPSNQHTFTLAYENDVFSSGQTIWDISV